MRFRDIYNVSLCKNGIIGGLLYVNQTELLYCTNKLSVSPEIRRLHLPYEEIASIEKAEFHTLIFKLKNGLSYRFLVFSRERFLDRVKALLP